MSNNHKSRTTKDPKPVGRHSPANIGYGARELVNRRTVSFCRPFVWLTRLISLSFKGVPPSLRFGAPGHAFGEHHRGRPRRRLGEVGFRPTSLWFGAATMFLVPWYHCAWRKQPTFSRPYRLPEIRHAQCS